MLLSVVIPTLNEAATIGPLVRELDSVLAGVEAEIIVLDDASSDGTAAAAQQASPRVRVVVRAHERGLATAVIRGLREAAGHYVVVMDGDGQHPPTAVKALLEKAQATAADLVVGSRYAKGGSAGAFSSPRRAVSKGAALLARIALPPLRAHGITDPMSGLFLVRRSLVHPDELQPRGYKVLLEILGRSRLDRIEEVGYEFRPRQSGESKLGGAILFPYIGHLTGLAFAHKENRRILHFAWIGLVGTAVNLAVLTALVERAEAPVHWALLGAIEVSLVSNFLLNDAITFRDRRTKPWLRRAGDYHVVSFLGAGINYGSALGLITYTPIDYRIAGVIGVVLGFVFNYAGNLFWTYRRHRPAPRPAPRAAPADLHQALAAIGLFESDVIQERPWGLWVDWFRTEEAVLKCMVVRPGARMSLQRHKKRREVWRVVAGKGEDQGADPPMPLTPGKTHVVGLGSVHRIANTGSDPLVIVELQMGDCDEHDIERLSDDFRRA